MSKTLRIALVIERMDPQRGGRERSVAEIAAELARRGHDVTVLCESGGLDAPRVNVLALGSSGATRAGRAARFARAVARKARGEGYDIVHATLPVPGANIYQPRGGTVPGALAAKARRAGPAGRVFRRITLALNPVRLLAWRREKRLVADPAVTCLALSEIVAEELAFHYGRRENVHVVYGGVEIPQADEPTRSAWREKWRSRWGAGEATTVFLTVAQNFALKGVAEAIESLAEYLRSAPGRDARLVVVGGGRAGRYRRIARKHGVADGVVFAGPAADVFPLYSAADAVVLLSWQDTCSRVVLEAIRWTVPSLTTRYNGAAELLAGGAGKVVESPRDRAGVLAALAELAEPSRRAAMADACRAVADFVRNARQVDELERIYTEVAGR